MKRMLTLMFGVLVALFAFVGEANANVIDDYGLHPTIDMEIPQDDQALDVDLYVDVGMSYSVYVEQSDITKIGKDLDIAIPVDWRSYLFTQDLHKVGFNDDGIGLIQLNKAPRNLGEP